MSELPLFPLPSVLFPGGRLGLQVFEPRYLDLVSSSLKSDTGFGIVLITEGKEVAKPGNKPKPGDKPKLPGLAEIGCHARIVDWDALPNGLLGITVEGDQRIRIASAKGKPGKLVMGDVEMLEPRPPTKMDEEWAPLLEVLGVLEKHPHVRSLGIKVDRKDAWRVGYVLSQLLPVDEMTKLELLREDDIGALMGKLNSIITRLSEEQ